MKNGNGQIEQNGNKQRKTNSDRKRGVPMRGRVLHRCINIKTEPYDDPMCLLSQYVRDHKFCHQYP